MTASPLTDTTRQQLSALFAEQTATAPRMKHTSAKDRIALLKKLSTAVEQHEGEICKAIYEDFKKPHEETKLTEIIPLQAEIKHTIGHLSDWMKPEKVSTPMMLTGTHSRIIREPKGVTLIISPWNYPIYLALSPLVSALSAGNTAVIKPSELTPATSAILSTLIGKTFERNQVGVAIGDAETSKYLLSLPFDHIFFTGSPQIGKSVMAAAAKNLSSVTLELGGKSPAYVDASADINHTAKKLVWGKFTNAGQTCVAPDYLLVHKQVAPQLLEAMRNRINKFYDKDGAGTEASESYARIVNQKHFERLNEWLQEAVQAGAKVAAGGQVNADDNFIAPTVLTDVPEDAHLLQDEIFGPILPVVIVESADEACSIIARKPKPLALYIFANDGQQVQRVLRLTTAGGTCINDCIIHLANPNLPFGGVNNSGIGRAHGHYGFRDFSNERAVLHQRTGLTTTEPLYPPFDQKTNTVLGLMKKLFA